MFVTFNVIKNGERKADAKSIEELKKSDSKHPNSSSNLPEKVPTEELKESESQPAPETE